MIKIGPFEMGRIYTATVKIRTEINGKQLRIKEGAFNLNGKTITVEPYWVVDRYDVEECGSSYNVGEVAMCPADIETESLFEVIEDGIMWISSGDLTDVKKLNNNEGAA